MDLGDPDRLTNNDLWVLCAIFYGNSGKVVVGRDGIYKAGEYLMDGPLSSDMLESGAEKLQRAGLVTIDIETSTFGLTPNGLKLIRRFHRPWKGVRGIMCEVWDHYRDKSVDAVKREFS